MASVVVVVAMGLAGVAGAVAAGDVAAGSVVVFWAIAPVAMSVAIAAPKLKLFKVMSYPFGWTDRRPINNAFPCRNIIVTAAFKSGQLVNAVRVPSID